MTLRLRLSLAFLAIVIVPLVVAAILVGRGVPHALDTAAGNRLASSRAAAQAIVRQDCAAVRLAAEDLAREYAAARTSSARAATARDIVSRRLADYAVVAAGNGSVVSSAGALGNAHPGPGQLGSCSRLSAPAPRTAAIADAIQVQSTNGRAIGQAAAALALDRTAAARLAASTDADVTLVEGSRVITSTEPARVATELAVHADALTASHGHAVGSRLAVAVPLSPTPVRLILSVNRSGVGGLETVLVSVLIAALLLSALIGWWLARVTTRPLAQLSDAAARVAGGDLDTRIDVTSRDEVGRLAAAFNDMTTELRTYVGEVEASRDVLRENLTRLGDTLSSTHDMGRILSVILDTAMTSVGATAGAAYVTQPGRDGLALRAGRGLEGRGAAPRLALGEGVTGQVAATGEARHGRVDAGRLALAEGEPTARQLISVPLRASGGILGVLNLYDRADEAPFGTSDLETIRTFAGQAAVALDNVLLHQEAQRLSVTDGLTGLGNYRSFQLALAREIERAARFRRSLALLMLDLDRFKQVNDVHGHQIGNVVLVEVAERLRTEVREVDVVARYGGEEFTVVLPESDSNGAGHIAERICEAMRRQPFRAGDVELPVTVSIGVAVFPVHGASVTALVRAADEALYAAKAAGRDQWRMVTESADPNSR